MARNFDGANDEITFGSDASIDGFGARTVALWINWGGSGVEDVLISKSNATGTSGWLLVTSVATNAALFSQDTTGTTGTWRGSTALNGAWHQVVIVYDGALGTPTMYVDGATESVSTISTPTGSASSDAGDSLYLGELAGSASDYLGAVGWVQYDNTQWDSSQVNRHRWYGKKGGNVPVDHPLWTSALTNQGTATANGTATGTTMTSSPKVERCYAMMMGVGR